MKSAKILAENDNPCRNSMPLWSNRYILIKTINKYNYRLISSKIIIFLLNIIIYINIILYNIFNILNLIIKDYILINII